MYSHSVMPVKYIPNVQITWPVHPVIGVARNMMLLMTLDGAYVKEIAQETTKVAKAFADFF